MNTRHALTVLLALLLVGSSGCGSDSTDDGAGTSTTATVTTAGTSTTASPATTAAVTTTASPATTTAEPVPASAPAVVYWAWTVPTVASGTPERLGAGGRDVAVGDAAAAVEALLAGPTDIETEIGMATEIPDGTTLLGLEVTDGTAFVDLSGQFETSSGTLSETMRIAQVVFTLTHYDEIDLVMFRIDGTDVDALGSHGFDVSSGLDRDDFTDVRPFILVEAPTPGATVDAAGFAINGESNTFEATVEWVVTDSDGLIVADGFTTATAGNGEWGRFEVPVELPQGTSGLGAVIVFTTSAADGSQIDVVEYPVEIS